MRAFQVIAVALAATAARGQIISGGLGIGGLSYGAGYAPSVSYGSLASPVSGYASVRSPVAYSTGSSVISSAPAISLRAAPAISVAAAPAVSVAAAPVVSVAAAPAVSYGLGGGLVGGLGGGLALGGASGGAIVTGTGGGIRSHEIHTGGVGNTIRIEEVKAGGQLIRVHDSPRLGTEVLNVQGPAAAGNQIRLISRSGPTQVQRSVVQDPNVQVFDVVNPPQPGDRVINIRRAPAPPAQVELVADQQQGIPEIQIGGDEPNIQVQHVGGAGASLSTAVLGASNIGGASYAAAAPIASRIATVSAAPVASYAVAAPAVQTISAAPVASYAVAAPSVQTISAAPAVAYSTGLRSISVPSVQTISAAPAVSYSTGLRTISSPVVGGSSYGSSLGGLSYGLGGSSLGGTTILGKRARKASA